MKFQCVFGIAAMVLLMTFSSTKVFASRLRLRPLTGEEVYRILKEAGREDAIPEGRIVTQGLAAATGFALGLKSGIAVPLAIGLATSNATQQFLNNINYTAITSSLPTIPSITLPTFNVSAITSNIPTINITALTSLFKRGSSSTTVPVQYTTQEICFSSRSLNEINDNDGDGDGDDDGDDYGDGDGDAAAEGRQATNPETTDATTGEIPTVMAFTSPTGTGPSTGTGPEPMNDDGIGTGTNTETTTRTDGGTVNCIVIQKPVGA